MAKNILWTLLAVLIFSCNGPNPEWEEFDEWSLDAIISNELKGGTPINDIYNIKYREDQFHGWAVREFVISDINRRVDAGETYFDLYETVYPAFFFDDSNIEGIFKQKIEEALINDTPIEQISEGYPEHLIHYYDYLIQPQFLTRYSNNENLEYLFSVFPLESLYGIELRTNERLMFVDTSTNQYLIIQGSLSFVNASTPCNSPITDSTFGSGSNNTVELMNKCAVTSPNLPEGYHIPSLVEMKHIIDNYNSPGPFLTSTTIEINSIHYMYYYENGEYLLYQPGVSSNPDIYILSCKLIGY